ncbi:MAG: hypothetical protein K2Y35_06055 [Burkholderiales bacterium]|nr:hypothetical protein [Burkholderiales bacterium]
MRVLWLLVGVLYSSFAWAQVAGLPGIYTLDAPGGTFTARIDVKGTALSGSIDLNGKPMLNLSGAVNGTYSRGTVSSKDGNGQYEAQVQGDVLQLLITQQAGPKQRAASLPMQFRRASAAATTAKPPTTSGPVDASVGDQRLIGHWISQEILGGGGTSLASEEHLVFRADGNYAYGKGRTAGGGADWSYDGGSGGEVERGRWRAEKGVLFVAVQNGQWARVGTYGMTDDGSTMRIVYDGGGRKLWSRQ